MTPTRPVREEVPGVPWPVLALSALFAFTGAAHFVRPALFDALVPGWVPFPARTAGLIAGAAELAGAAGLLHPATRPAARLGLLALLVAVFPGNLHMAQNAEQFPVPAWVAWARLPLQPLLRWVVWRAGKVRP